LARRDLAGARRILEESIACSPKALWPRLFLVDMLMRVAKDEKAAEHHLRGILAIAPNEPQARIKLAQLLGARGK
jgi:predicted Zn-dependent protease